jgi:hypothetical protein
MIYKFDPHFGQACPHCLQESPKCINRHLTAGINITILKLYQQIKVIVLSNSRLINFNSDARMDKGSKKCPTYKLIFFGTTLASLPLTLPINSIIIIKN